MSIKDSIYKRVINALIVTYDCAVGCLHLGYFKPVKEYVSVTAMHRMQQVQRAYSTAVVLHTKVLFIALRYFKIHRRPLTTSLDMGSAQYTMGNKCVYVSICWTLLIFKMVSSRG